MTSNIPAPNITYPDVRYSDGHTIAIWADERGKIAALRLRKK